MVAINLTKNTQLFIMKRKWEPRVQIYEAKGWENQHFILLVLVTPWSSKTFHWLQYPEWYWKIVFLQYVQDESQKKLTDMYKNQKMWHLHVYFWPLRRRQTFSLIVTGDYKKCMQRNYIHHMKKFKQLIHDERIKTFFWNKKMCGFYAPEEQL